MNDSPELPGNWEQMDAPVPYQEALGEAHEYYSPTDPALEFAAINTPLRVILEYRLLSPNSNEQLRVEAHSTETGDVLKATTAESVSTDRLVPMIDVLALSEENAIDARQTEAIGGQIFPNSPSVAQRKVQAVIELASNYHDNPTIETSPAFDTAAPHPVILALMDLRNPSSTTP